MYISERNWKIRQKISEECKSFRKTLGITELEVAKMTGNSLSSVHLFEQGKKDSGTILIWYIANGLELYYPDFMNLFLKQG